MQPTKPTVYLTYINTVLLIVIGVFVFLYPTNQEKLVFVDNATIFENFNMSKEMKAAGEKEFSSRKKIIDSLYLELNDLSSNSSKEQLMQKIIYEKDNLESFTQNYISQESLKIWKRINIYAKDFSEQKGYQMILGFQSNNIIYAGEQKDVTNEFLVFINKKYEGHN